MNEAEQTERATDGRSPLTEELGHRLRSAQVWVRHSHYTATEQAGYVRDTSPFEAADVLDMQAREIQALRADLAAERENVAAMCDAAASELRGLLETGVADALRLAQVAEDLAAQIRWPNAQFSRADEC